MKIAHISPGAAGMYCGTCIHNNTLARGLKKHGHDALLIPLYTPIRTDEESVAIDRVFFGAVNVYLKQGGGLWKYAPRFVQKWLDNPALLNWVSRFSSSTNAKMLGEMTVSVLQGEHGPQRDAVEELVEWLQEDVKPDVVHVSLSLFLGLVPRIKEALGVPVVCELQGEDIFFDDLIEPYRSQALELVQQHCDHVEAFIVPCEYYRELMSQEYGFPADRTHVVPLGIEPESFKTGDAKTGDAQANDPVTIGFLARIAPEKGLHVLTEAFKLLTDEIGTERVRLRAAGHLREYDRAYFDKEVKRLKKWGLEDSFEYVGEVDRDGKANFLAGLDIFSTPTVYREPKGLPMLEALASGVPVVVPSHGAYPELIQETGGGVLVTPESPKDLARALRELVEDAERRRALGLRGRQAVHAGRTSDVMAQRTADVYEVALGISLKAVA